MTKTVFMMQVVSVVILGTGLVVARPMDMEAAKKIPELERVLLNVREKGRLTDHDRLVVEGNLGSGDPVLVSLATCIVAESKGEETNLCANAEAVLKTAQGMPQAFIRLMLAKKRTEDKKPSERVAVIELLLKDANPYLQVEVAKELFKNDVRIGEDALRTLLSVDSPIAKGEAFRQLHKIGKAKNAVPVPMPDEQDELLLSIIENGHGRYGP